MLVTAMPRPRMAQSRTPWSRIAEPFEAIVERLRASCPDFDRWWNDHDVRSPSFRNKTLNTPSGRQRYTSMTFEVCGYPALRLTVFMPLDG